MIGRFMQVIDSLIGAIDTIPLSFLIAYGVQQVFNELFIGIIVIAYHEWKNNLVSIVYGIGRTINEIGYLRYVNLFHDAFDVS
jgi:hypothetical protein